MDTFFFLASIDGTVLNLVLALAVTGILVDTFIGTEIISQASILIFSFWLEIRIAELLNLHAFWHVALYITCLIIAELCYFFLWKGCVKSLGNLTLRNASQESKEKVQGFRGPVTISDGHILIHYMEEYMMVDPSCTAGLEEGTMVEIDSQTKEGTLIVHRI